MKGKSTCNMAQLKKEQVKQTLTVSVDQLGLTVLDPSQHTWVKMTPGYTGRYESSEYTVSVQLI